MTITMANQVFTKQLSAFPPDIKSQYIYKYPQNISAQLKSKVCLSLAIRFPVPQQKKTIFPKTITMVNQVFTKQLRFP